MAVSKYELKNGIGWRATIQVSPTKQISKKFRRRIDAERWEQERRLLNSSGQLQERSVTTFGRLAEEWLTSYAKLHLEGSSQARYRAFLRIQILPEFERCRLDQISPQKVEAWQLKLRDRDKLSPKTVNDCLGLLRKILNDAVRWRYIPANPVSGLRRLKLPDAEFAFWTKDQARQFLAHVLDHHPDRYPFYFIALNTGMRLGEITALKWDAVDLGNAQIVVKRTFCLSERRVKETTKANRIRRVPINRPLLKILSALKLEGYGEFVVGDQDAVHMGHRTRRLSLEAGVPSLCQHALRHTFASLWMMEGKPIFELQKILGHSSIAMTERYSHLAPEHLAGKTEFLDLDVAKRADIVPLRSEG